MKRAYITPNSEVVDLNLESSILCPSIVIQKSSDETLECDLGLSNKGGWSSDNWSGEE